jgi:hypothetical protein
MTIFLFSFIGVALFMLLLGVGVLMGRPPIRGSCGGSGNPEDCEFCSNRCRNTST